MTKSNNLIDLFPDMDTQMNQASIDELAREIIRCMKEYGECMDPKLWDEIKILCPPDEYPRERVQKLDPIPPGPPRTLRQAFGLRPLRKKRKPT
jgi:hypothetical protein